MKKLSPIIQIILGLVLMGAADIAGFWYLLPLGAAVPGFFAAHTGTALLTQGLASLLVRGAGLVFIITGGPGREAAEVTGAMLGWDKGTAFLILGGASMVSALVLALAGGWLGRSLSFMLENRSMESSPAPDSDKTNETSSLA